MGNIARGSFNLRDRFGLISRTKRIKDFITMKIGFTYTSRLEEK